MTLSLGLTDHMIISIFMNWFILTKLSRKMKDKLIFWEKVSDFRFLRSIFEVIPGHSRSQIPKKVNFQSLSKEVLICWNKALEYVCTSMFRGHSRSLKVNNIYNTSKKQKFKFLSQVMKFQSSNEVLTWVWEITMFWGHLRSPKVKSSKNVSKRGKVQYFAKLWKKTSQWRSWDES